MESEVFLFMLGRIILGVYFVKSGYNHFKNLNGMTGYAQSKGLMMPRESTIVTGAMMLIGGIGVLLGVYVTLSLSLLAIFLFLSAFFMHRYWKETDPMVKMGERINFEKNLALGGAILMLLSLPIPWEMIAR
jgi:putative oxidoreductase